MKLRKIINVCITVAVLASWMSMTLHGKGTLAQNGLGNLKYFTILSNLFEGAASIIWLASAGRGKEAKDRAERVKYIAAASVALTFTVVIIFLGPLYGYAAMFSGPSLFLHMLIPLTAVAEIIFLSDAEYSVRDNNYVMIPPLLYGIAYYGNNIINGTGEWPNSNDWYGFLLWGYPVGIVIFVIIGIITWLLGLLMRKLKRSVLR